MAITYDPKEIRLAPEGKAYINSVGATEPVDVTTPWDVTWRELGWVSEDGISITPSVETNDIRMWQSVTAAKRPVTGMELEVDLPLASFNRDTLGLFFLNSTWQTVGGVGRLEMPNAPGSQEVALGIEWTDDEGDVNRLIFPRMTLTDREALNLQRSEAIALGLSLSAMAGPAGYSAVFLTNNPDLVS